jgi:hemoglobin
MTTLYEELGGEARLTAIIGTFVDRVYDDTMIGFFFRRVSRDRLKQKEFEFAAEHLGGDVRYTGRPLQDAHKAHPIMGGQFMRRLQILKQTLAEYEVPERVQKHWIDHTLSLRPLITSDPIGECNPVVARERTSPDEEGA